MSTPKGYPSQEKDDRLKAQFCTVEPVSEKQFGLTVAAHMFAYTATSDAVEANSTTYVINATAHAAIPGDVIKITSGALSGKEVRVASTTTNTITLAETLSSALATGVTFDILRFKVPTINSDGTPTTGPLSYKLDGVTTQVTKDTITPANNRPLPVELVNASGVINVTAGDLNVQLSHLGANYDSTRIGDGTTLLGITGSGEAKVSVTSALPAGANNIGQVDVASSALPTGAATEATLSALNAKFSSLGQKAMAASAPVVIASDQSAIPASQSGTWNINNISGAVSLPTGAATEATLAAMSAKLPATLGQKAMAASLAVVVASDQSAIPASQSGTWNINNISGTVSLPTGASTEATLSALSAKFGALGQALMAASAPVVIASDQSAIPASQSGTWNINNISGTVSLPTGASTEATLSAFSAKFNSLGQKTMANSAPVVISSDQSAIPASQSGTWNINNISGTVSLPTGAATEATLSAASAKLPATLGQKTMANSMAVVIASDQSAVTVDNNLTVVDLLDANILDTSTTNIPGSAGSPVTAVASLASAVKKIQIFDTTGAFVGVYTGAAASEVLLFTFGPGSNETTDVKISAGTRISFKRLDSTTAVSSGIVSINCIG